MNRRDFLKLTALGAMFPTNILAAQKHHVPVLMYHDINNDPQDEYSVTPEEFKKQMYWLRDNGYKAVPYHWLDDHEDKTVVITFDDGYYSFLEHAFPILKELNFPATISVVGKWAGKQIPDIKLRKALSWDDMKKLHDTNLVTFGCHTWALHELKRHNVNNRSKQWIKRDLLMFQTQYYSVFKTTCDIIAWPFGMYNDTAIEAAKELGFTYFLTSHRGKYNGNKDRIPRYPIMKGHDVASYLG